MNPSSSRPLARRGDDVADVADPELARVTTARRPARRCRGHRAGHVGDADRRGRNRRCSAKSTPAAGRPRSHGASTLARRRPRRARSRASGHRPRRPWRLTALQRRAEDRGHARVRGVARHPRAVDVVVAQRDGRARRLAGPCGRVVLLSDLARGVRAARVQGRRLVDQAPAQRAPAHRALVSKSPTLQRLARPRRGGLPPCPGSRTAPRRRRPSTTPARAAHPALVHRRQQGGGAEVVVAGVHGQVGHRGAGTHQGRQVTTTSMPSSRSAQSAASRTSSWWRPTCGARAPVGLRQQHVDGHHVVPRGGRSRAPCR